jgi:multidrug resistance efflux pump
VSLWMILHLGALPTIRNDKRWLRDAQRYPVLIDLDLSDFDQPLRLKVGSQATALVFTGDHVLFNPLARIYLWLQAWLTYAY